MPNVDIVGAAVPSAQRYYQTKQTAASALVVTREMGRSQALLTRLGLDLFLRTGPRGGFQASAL